MNNEKLIESWDIDIITYLQSCKYGSCKLIVADNGFTDCYALKSYNTIVETLEQYADATGWTYRFTGTYSVTTMRHMRAFRDEMKTRRRLILPGYKPLSHIFKGGILSCELMPERFKGCDCWQAITHDNGLDCWHIVAGDAIVASGYTDDSAERLKKVLRGIQG